MLKHLRYFLLGFTGKTFWYWVLYLAYCGAPIYLKMSLNMAGWWYGVPLVGFIIGGIYARGKYIDYLKNRKD